MTTARLADLGPVLAVSLSLAACGGPPGMALDEAADTPRATPSAAVVPSFTVDPTWPRELPNDWIIGAVTAVFVDAQDHVWVTHLPETLTPEEAAAVQEPPIGSCCVPAPVVLEFDADGALVQGWGDPATQDVSEFPRNAPASSSTTTTSSGSAPTGTTAS